MYNTNYNINKTATSSRDRPNRSRLAVWDMVVTATKKEPLLWFFFLFGCSNNLSSRTVASQVFSALVSLTSVFGMRTGGTSPLTSPQWYISGFTLGISTFQCTYIVHLFQSPVKFFTR